MRQKKRWQPQVPNPKLQDPNNIQTELIKKPTVQESSKPRDLEDRTFQFAQSVRAFVKQLPRTISNTEDVRQLVRASGSVAANWIEADEALSKTDFLMRVKICRKESKESRLFLRLIDAGLTKNNLANREALG
jgi:four helix bundle protein